MNSEFVSLFVSAGSLLVSCGAVLIARSSLNQAKQVSERERREWRQRKWFDLFLKADEAYNALDYFQAQYSAACMNPERRANDWNNLMRTIREAYSMAGVFPKSPATDELFLCTKFKTFEEAISKERLSKLLAAVESLRMKALIDKSVLGESGA